MKNLGLILFAIAIIFLAGCNQVQQADDKAMDKNDVEVSNAEPQLLAGNQAKYYAFDKQAYDKALMENEIILLYFYANWCPICRAEQPKTFAAFNELDNPNIVGFRVNYKDSDTDEFEEQLAREFGITYQHTKVILKSGERVLKAPDSWDKERYIEELSKVA